MDGKSKLILIIGIVAIFFAIVISTISIVMMTKTLNNNSEKEEEEEVEQAVPIEETVNFDLQNAIIGTLPSEEDPDKMMNISIEIGFKLDTNNKQTEDVLLLMEQNEWVIQDRIAKILEKKTLEMMQKPDSTENLQNEILAAISREFDTDAIIEVYFGKNLKSIK